MLWLCFVFFFKRKDVILVNAQLVTCTSSDEDRCTAPSLHCIFMGQLQMCERLTQPELGKVIFRLLASNFVQWSL